MKKLWINILITAFDALLHALIRAGVVEKVGDDDESEGSAE